MAPRRPRNTGSKIPPKKKAVRPRGRPPAPPEGTRAARFAGDIHEHVLDPSDDSKLMIGTTAALQRQKEIGPGYDAELVEAAKAAVELGICDERTADIIVRAEQAMRTLGTGDALLAALDQVAAARADAAKRGPGRPEKGESGPDVDWREEERKLLTNELSLPGSRRSLEQHRKKRGAPK